nr:uncharacterized protein LOC118037007 [Populus alba]
MKRRDMKNIRKGEDKRTRRKGKVTRMSDRESVTITNNNLIRSCIWSARVCRIWGAKRTRGRIERPKRNRENPRTEEQKKNTQEREIERARERGSERRD